MKHYISPKLILASSEKYILNAIPHVKTCSYLLGQKPNNEIGDN